MQRVELVLGLVVLALWIYSVVSCVLTPESQVRGIPKVAWLVVIVLLPLLGSVLWLGVGRSAAPRLPRLRTAGVGPQPGPRAYQAMTADDRIRRMEEELAQLERESDRPDDGEPRRGRA